MNSTTQGPVLSPLVLAARRLELREACCLEFFWDTNLLLSLSFGDASSTTSSLLLRFAGFLEIISVATAFEIHHQESRWRSRPMMIARNSVSWAPVLMVLLRLPFFVPEVDDEKNTNSFETAEQAPACFLPSTIQTVHKALLIINNNGICYLFLFFA